MKGFTGLEWFKKYSLSNYIYFIFWTIILLLFITFLLPTIMELYIQWSVSWHDGCTAPCL